MVTEAPRELGRTGQVLGIRNGETVWVDIVGGTHTDPGDTELDDAIEQIVGDYIPDTLLRVQLAQRILAEVLRRTPISDPYTRPTH